MILSDAHGVILQRRSGAGDAKLDLARRLGASVTINARNDDPATLIEGETGIERETGIKRETGGGINHVLVTAVSPKAFEQAIGDSNAVGSREIIGITTTCRRVCCASPMACGGRSETNPKRNPQGRSAIKKARVRHLLQRWSG